MIFEGTSEGDIQFDATMSEDTTASNTMTKNPIEFGADITDHNYVNPKILVMEGGVTNTPIRRLTTFGGGFSRSEDAWDVLQRIKDRGDIFTAITSLERVSSVVIVDLTTRQDSATANALIFRATLEQIIVTESDQLQLTAAQLADIVNKQAASNKDRGQVDQKPASQSLLSRAADWVSKIGL